MGGISILTLFFYFNIEVAILGLLPLHENFRITLLILTDSLLEFLLGLCFIYTSSWEELISWQYGVLLFFCIICFGSFPHLTGKNT